MTRIFTPVEGYTGTVAGAAFADGVAEVELDASQRLYFQNHGYGIGKPAQIGVDAAVARPLKALVGSSLRDAAQGDQRTVQIVVDGEVVYEGLHDVDEVDDLVHEAAQPVHVAELEEAPLPSDGSEPIERPNVRAPITDWRAWALTLPDADADKVAAMTKPELQALGTPEEG